MTTSQDNFHKWFVSPLEALNEDEHAAFVVLMVAFPLLERYLREKSGVGEGALTDHFYDKFYKIIRAPSRDRVPDLWHSYRNGLLHQATFSKKKRNGRVMPASFITSAVSLIEYDSDNGSFYVNPKTFSEKIITEIQDNFDVFEGMSSENHPLPQVRSIPPVADTGDTPRESGVP